MGQRYDSIKAFSQRNIEHNLVVVCEELVLFERIAELILEPIDQWADLEDSDALLLLVARMFNDYEAAKNQIVVGLHDQSFSSIRDSFECMLILRLFLIEPERARRWMENLSEYAAGSVKKALNELGIETPEYGCYGPLSKLAHPNFLASTHLVTETEVSRDIVLRRYSFGAYRNDNWLKINFRNLLAYMMFLLLMVLPSVYSLLMSREDLEPWCERVWELVAVLEQFGILNAEEFPQSASDRPRTPNDRRRFELMKKKLEFKFLLFPEHDK